VDHQEKSRSILSLSFFSYIDVSELDGSPITNTGYIHLSHRITIKKEEESDADETKKGLRHDYIIFTQFLGVIGDRGGPQSSDGVIFSHNDTHKTAGHKYLPRMLTTMPSNMIMDVISPLLAAEMQLMVKSFSLTGPPRLKYYFNVIKYDS